MTHGHLKFINSFISLQVFSYWIISPYARLLYTIRFHLVAGLF
jgi:hypothetical protein